MLLQIVVSIPLADEMFASAKTTHEVGHHLKTFVNTLEEQGHTVTLTSSIESGEGGKVGRKPRGGGLTRVRNGTISRRRGVTHGVPSSNGEAPPDVT